MTLVRRSPAPFGDLVSLRHAMDRLFDDSFVRARGWGFGDTLTNLPLDITSTADALIVEAALPGYRPEDVEITVEDGTLTIRAESREERESKDGESLVREIRRGSAAVPDDGPGTRIVGGWRPSASGTSSGTIERLPST